MALNCIAVDEEQSSLSYITRYIAENTELNLVYTTIYPIEAQNFIENN